MTEQQRTTRIEFVKKLLKANGFEEHKPINSWEIPFIKNVNYFQYQINVGDDLVSYCIFPHGRKAVFHVHPLTPLRDFIKLSNQK